MHHAWKMAIAALIGSTLTAGCGAAQLEMSAQPEWATELDPLCAIGRAAIGDDLGAAHAEAIAAARAELKPVADEHYEKSWPTLFGAWSKRNAQVGGQLVNLTCLGSTYARPHGDVHVATITSIYSGTYHAPTTGMFELSEQKVELAKRAEKADMELRAAMAEYDDEVEEAPCNDDSECTDGHVCLNSVCASPPAEPAESAEDASRADAAPDEAPETTWPGWFSQVPPLCGVGTTPVTTPMASGITTADRRAREDLSRTMGLSVLSGSRVTRRVMVDRHHFSLVCSEPGVMHDAVRKTFADFISSEAPAGPEEGRGAGAADWFTTPPPECGTGVVAAQTDREAVLRSVHEAANRDLAASVLHDSESDEALVSMSGTDLKRIWFDASGLVYGLACWSDDRTRLTKEGTQPPMEQFGLRSEYDTAAGGEKGDADLKLIEEEMKKYDD